MKTISFSNLTINIEESDQEVVYSFDGDVDENFRQNDVPRIARPKISLVLGRVENFNSVGIREWIHFISDLCKMGTPTFRECSVAMIDQINMVPESLGSGTVDTFYAPYYCECGKEVNKLIKTSEWRDHLLKSIAPQFQCDGCNRALEFDALEESYFQFVATLSRVI
ncbi:hypothetical protein [Pseudobacteriovorax antillogorgiicola]|uniref:Uncharacterized protein n=1 Tax=Pseudobacteriovorax antillogorgiicola TaxID=1513793 RepID=A0A1Y6BP70_9BACT|nr:hypothetical protein [Pseudobacteriovorax antillogorgiicola]TCS55350.1 hypothetical protein EDD56_10571 [Pseudobacteriovorax antillogorgiicola]SMF13778.1 hypothetical protein SAMN06296036_105253 [Pseudobacteriovorax antillogorgiicola]